MKYLSRYPVVFLTCAVVWTFTSLVSGQHRHPDTTPRAAKLQNNIPITNLALGAGESFLYVLTVPRDATKLTIASAGGRGDVDLYVRFNQIPGREQYDFRSIQTGTTESVIIEKPKPGHYYILVSAFRSSTGVGIVGKYEGCEICDDPTTGRLVADRYESDNTLARPSRFHGEKQNRTIHRPEDRDWIEYTPPTAGFYRLNITAPELPLKVEVFTAVSQEASPLATFGTTVGQTSIPMLASGRAKVFLVGISSPHRKTGAYQISFEKVTGVLADPGHRPGHHPPALPPADVPCPDHPETHNPGQPIPTASILRSGDRKRNLEGDRGTRLYYRVYVPRNSKVARISLGDGKGNADLYIEHESLPTLHSRIFSNGPTNREIIEISNPEPGWYIIMIYGRSDFEELDLMGHVK